MDAERARARQADAAQRLREIYGSEPLGDMMGVAIQHLENIDEFLLDSVEQAKVDYWHNDRIVLLGNAAWCSTLYSRAGAASALAGADALGLVPAEHSDDVETALSAWENKFRPAVTDFQQSAYLMRAIFTQISAKEQRR